MREVKIKRLYDDVSMPEIDNKNGLEIKAYFHSENNDKITHIKTSDKYIEIKTGLVFNTTGQLILRSHNINLSFDAVNIVFKGEELVLTVKNCTGESINIRNGASIGYFIFIPVEECVISEEG